MKQPFAIFRINKLKNSGAINGAAAHIMRTRETPNANPDGRCEVLHCSAGHPQKISDAVDIEIGNRRTRKDSVKAVEVLLSASPEYFRSEDPTAAGTWNEQKLNDWRAAVEPWIRDNFPHAVLIALHLDESTPHYSIIDVPIDGKDNLSCKNKYGGKSRTDIARWHTSFAKCVDHLGIKRGLE